MQIKRDVKCKPPNGEQDNLVIHSERVDRSSLGKQGTNLLKQLLKNSKHLQEKISRIEDEIEG